MVDVALTVSVLVVGAGVTVVPTSRVNVFVEVTRTVDPVLVVKMVVLIVLGIVVVIVDVDRGVVVVIVDVDREVDNVDEVVEIAEEVADELGTVKLAAVKGEE